VRQGKLVMFVKSSESASGDLREVSQN